MEVDVEVRHHLWGKCIGANRFSRLGISEEDNLNLEVGIPTFGATHTDAMAD